MAMCRTRTLTRARDLRVFKRAAAGDAGHRGNTYDTCRDATFVGKDSLNRPLNLAKASPLAKLNAARAPGTSR